MDSNPETAVLFVEDVDEGGDEDEDERNRLENDSYESFSLRLTSADKRAGAIIRDLFQAAVLHRHPVPPAVRSARFD